MTGPITLAPRLDTQAADTLLNTILARRGQDMLLDAGRVSHLGTLCLQILLAARKDWRAQGLKFEFSTCSEAFDRAVSTYGLNRDDLTSQETSGVRVSEVDVWG